MQGAASCVLPSRCCATCNQCSQRLTWWRWLYCKCMEFRCKYSYVKKKSKTFRPLKCRKNPLEKQIKQQTKYNILFERNVKKWSGARRRAVSHLLAAAQPPFMLWEMTAALESGRGGFFSCFSVTDQPSRMKNRFPNLKMNHLIIKKC